MSQTLVEIVEGLPKLSIKDLNYDAKLKKAVANGSLAKNRVAELEA